MHFRSITRIVGILITLLSLSMLLPIIVAIVYRDGGGVTFGRAFLCAFIPGSLLWLSNRGYRKELTHREGFLVVVLFWVVLGAIAAFPFLFDKDVNLNITNAFFESFSGLTTTGATTITGLDHLPKSFLFYRQLLQWLGGMGIIVLAVAVLPLLGVGGMQLYKAEIPGPQKEDKMRPRIAQTAKTLWFIYIVLTILCCICLFLAGMTGFDALVHSFSTISMGGFSTHDQNLAYFHNSAVNYIVTIFIILSGCNFSLHFMALRGFSFKIYWRDQEFRTFIIVLSALALFAIVMLYSAQIKSEVNSFDTIILQVVSTASTAGFKVAEMNNWPVFLPVLLICASFIGGCAGSTGGGLKVVRVVLMLMQGSREMKRLIHPNGIYTLKLNNKALSGWISESVWSFVFAYAFIFFISFFLAMASGLMPLNAFYLVSSSLNNLGISVVSLTDSFDHLNELTKWIMMLDMLFGRLEIFTLLILFTPVFWRG